MDGIVLTDWNNSPTRDEVEIRVVRVWLLGLAVVCVVSTVLHYCFPGVLKVPVELLKGKEIPYGTPGWTLLIELNVVCLSMLCLHHARRRLGPYKATMFFAGSFIFTGIEESLWILIGRFKGPIGGVLQSSELTHLGEAGATYYFTRGGLWFFETPLTACLSWFLLAYSCLYAADLLMPRAQVVWRATLAGLLAVNLDMLLDPVQTHEAFLSWIWETPGPIRLFGIRLSNYIGWFLMIFLFGVVYARLPAMLSRLGPRRTAARFMGILVVCAMGAMLVIAGYSTMVMWLVGKGINLTLWGVGA